MTPQEIHHLLQQSPTLREAMHAHKTRIWQFLRQEVRTCIHMSDAYVVPTMTIIGQVLVLQPHTVPCEKCTRSYTHDMLLESPYNGPEPAGWCIDCILDEFLIGGPLLADRARDPRSRTYDAEYDEQCRNAVYCWVVDYNKDDEPR